MISMVLCSCLVRHSPDVELNRYVTDVMFEGEYYFPKGAANRRELLRFVSKAANKEGLEEYLKNPLLDERIQFIELSLVKGELITFKFTNENGELLHSRSLLYVQTDRYLKIKDKRALWLDDKGNVYPTIDDYSLMDDILLNKKSPDLNYCILKRVKFSPEAGNDD